MSTKTSSKKTTATKSSKKTTKPATKKTTSAKAKKPAVDPALEALKSSVPMVARAMTEQEQAEFTGATRVFPGAALPAKKSKKTATPKAEKASRVTVTSVAEDLIKAGKTDEEVLAKLVEQFDDFDSTKKRHYPSWYRARLVRTGAITAAFADEHRHSKVSRDIPAREEA